MKVTVGDITNNKVDVRDYLNYDTEEMKIYVDGLKLDTVLIDKSKEWESLVDRNKRYHDLVNKIMYFISHPLSKTLNKDKTLHQIDNLLKAYVQESEGGSE